VLTTVTNRGTIRTPESDALSPYAHHRRRDVLLCTVMLGCRQAHATEVFAARGASNVLLGSHAASRMRPKPQIFPHASLSAVSR